MNVSHENSKHPNLSVPSTDTPNDPLSELFANSDTAIDLSKDAPDIHPSLHYRYNKHTNVYTMVYEELHNEGYSTWHYEECLPDEVEDLFFSFADFDEDSKYYFNP